jgi:hypothetical protein
MKKYGDIYKHIFNKIGRNNEAGIAQWVQRRAKDWTDERQVCRLQMLLALASAVILGSDSRGIHDHILRSQIRDSPNL